EAKPPGFATVMLASWPNKCGHRQRQRLRCHSANTLSANVFPTDRAVNKFAAMSSDAEWRPGSWASAAVGGCAANGTAFRVAADHVGCWHQDRSGTHAVRDCTHGTRHLPPPVARRRRVHPLSDRCSDQKADGLAWRYCGQTA